MLIKVDFLAHIICDGISGYYFYHKPTKYLLNIEVPTTKNYRIKDAPLPSTTTLETLERVIAGLKAQVEQMKIYLYQEGYYYTYITLQKDRVIYDINSNLQDAIEIALNNNAEIHIEESILKQNGFKITKQMLEKALKED